MTYTTDARALPSRHQSSLSACLPQLAVSVVICLAASAAQAQSPGAETPAASPQAKSTTTEPSPAKTEQRRAEVAEAQVEIHVIEDDSTRIEETRVRGQTQKVTVQSKNSKLPSYEIIMGDGSRDLSAGPGSTRGAAGKRVWNVFNF